MWRDRVFSSQSFTETIRQNIELIGEDLRTELSTWIEQSITPILEHAQQRKEMWDTQAKRLEALLENPADVPEEIERLKKEEEHLTDELGALERIIIQVNHSEESPQA